MFARLCLLPGGFDQQSAAAVTADLGLPRAQMWALLTGLARKSMIVIDTQRTGRFRILESLRAFGQEVLTEADQLVPAQISLLEWLVTFEEQLFKHPWGDELTVIEHRIVAELDNLRYGVHVSAAIGHPSHPNLAILLSRFLANTFDLAEVNRLLSEVLSNPLSSPLHRARTHCLGSRRTTPDKAILKPPSVTRTKLSRWPVGSMTWRHWRWRSPA